MLRPALFALCAFVFVSPAFAAEFKIEKSDDGLAVNLDGKLVTRYVTKSVSKPILWPIIGPTGKELPRHALRTDAVIPWVSSEPSNESSKLELLAAVLPQSPGLVRVSFGTEQDGRLGVVSVWSSSAAAQAYWTAERRAAVSSVIGPHTLSTFDAPVVLDAALAKQESP